MMRSTFQIVILKALARCSSGREYAGELYVQVDRVMKVLNNDPNYRLREATLFENLRKLVADGCVERECGSGADSISLPRTRNSPRHDNRVYYRLTPVGAKVIRDFDLIGAVNRASEPKAEEHEVPGLPLLDPI